MRIIVLGAIRVANLIATDLSQDKQVVFSKIEVIKKYIRQPNQDFFDRNCKF